MCFTLVGLAGFGAVKCVPIPLVPNSLSLTQSFAAVCATRSATRRNASGCGRKRGRRSGRRHWPKQEARGSPRSRRRSVAHEEPMAEPPARRSAEANNRNKFSCRVTYVPPTHGTCLSPLTTPCPASRVVTGGHTSSSALLPLGGLQLRGLGLQLPVPCDGALDRHDRRVAKAAHHDGPKEHAAEARRFSTRVRRRRAGGASGGCHGTSERQERVGAAARCMRTSSSWRSRRP